MTNPATSTVPSENTALAAGLQIKAAPRRSQLLIVDDDPAIRELACDLLEDAGYKVMTAGDGHEALRRIGGTLPDLVITDLHMPRMSGFELLKVLRQRFPQIPVIAVSAEFNGTALPPGVIADVFLSKDCYTSPRLSATIEELLAISPMREAVANRHEEARHEVAYLDADSRAVLGRLAGEIAPLPQGSAMSSFAVGDGRGQRPSAFATSSE